MSDDVVTAHDHGNCELCGLLEHRAAGLRETVARAITYLNEALTSPPGDWGFSSADIAKLRAAAAELEGLGDERR